MTAVERLINTARGEIGYLEKKTNAHLDDKFANPGRNDWTKYARDLDNIGIYNGKKNGYAWCDMFVDWCFVTTFGLEKALALTCQKMKGSGAGCTYSAKYYQDKNQFFRSNPKPGDQIFYTNNGGKTSYHTGLVVKVTSSRVYTIEGNTNSKPGVVENGGTVEEKNYPINYKYIYGYGRPDYSIIDVEEDEDMTLDKFTELFMSMRKELQDNDCSSFSEAARTWAVENGLVQGNGTVDANGNPNLMWEDFLSREQFITVLYRFYLLMNETPKK